VSAAAPVLAGTEEQGHARVVLGSALATGRPSHAYLFHGPAGTGKREAARAFAAELLAAGQADPDAVRRRVLAGTHPDLTWVAPTGAHVMRVDDVDGPVVGASARTPFEADRRVFVLERVDTMNDEVANRLLKTLEEPPPFAHLMLVTDALGQVIETVRSRCQLVRFDPLPPERLAERLERDGVPRERALACGRLAQGNADRARFLASEEGEALRADVEAMLRAALERDVGGAPAPDAGEPWRGLLERAEAACSAAETAAAELAKERLELEPKGRERRGLERELEEAGKREGRRARTRVLDLGLELVALGVRDLLCAREGATEAVLAADRLPALERAAQGLDARRLREAIERCEDARLSLQLNVNEELALAALQMRLAGLLAAR
jgi:DNA polymerase III subunit delta'